MKQLVRPQISRYGSVGTAYNSTASAVDPDILFSVPESIGKPLRVLALPQVPVP